VFPSNFPVLSDETRFDGSVGAWRRFVPGVGLCLASVCVWRRFVPPSLRSLFYCRSLAVQDEGHRLLRNVGNHLHSDAASYPGKNRVTDLKL
jgi:hypothetical protein